MIDNITSWWTKGGATILLNFYSHANEMEEAAKETLDIFIVEPWWQRKRGIRLDKKWRDQFGRPWNSNIRIQVAVSRVNYYRFVWPPPSAAAIRTVYGDMETISCTRNASVILQCHICRAFSAAISDWMIGCLLFDGWFCRCHHPSPRWTVRKTIQRKYEENDDDDRMCTLWRW